MGYRCFHNGLVPSVSRKTPNKNAPLKGLQQEQTNTRLHPITRSLSPSPSSFPSTSTSPSYFTPTHTHHVHHHFNPSTTDERWDDWQEDEQQESCQCLFCPFQSPTAREIFQHCAQTHDFDLAQVKANLGLDFYQCVRLVNYIRHQVCHSL